MQFVSRHLVHEWSPDGKYVAATVFQKPRTSQLVLMSVADASVRVLRNAHFQWNQMRFSRDGRFVAYDLSSQGGSSPRDIFSMPAEGGPETPLVRHPAKDVLLEWTPDGRGVLFASDRSGRWDLWVIEVFEGKPRGAPQLVYPNIGPEFTNLGFVRDGSYYYGATVYESDLYLATLGAARNTLQGPVQLAARHTGGGTSPAWSRDGRYLAYVRGRGSDHDPFILGIRSAQTGEERQLRLDGLRRHGDHGFDPRWSPDGRFILADARERDYPGPLIDSQGLYRIDVQTGSVTPLVYAQLAHGPNRIDSPAWAPDGRAIFERRPPQSIVARNLDTGDEKELYRPVPPAQVHHWPTSNLAVSPDGQRLAFVWTDGKTEERATALIVLPTAGGEPREVVRAQEPEQISLPAWMPDSRHIMYARGVSLAGSVSGEKQRFELWRIAAEGGEPQRLGLVMEGLAPYGLSVHPDGTRIAFTAGMWRRSEVWVLRDFLPVRQTAK
jgi:Tol biopolymer transport system component